MKSNVRILHVDARQSPVAPPPGMAVAHVTLNFRLLSKTDTKALVEYNLLVTCPHGFVAMTGDVELVAENSKEKEMLEELAKKENTHTHRYTLSIISSKIQPLLLILEKELNLPQTPLTPFQIQPCHPNQPSPQAPAQEQREEGQTKTLYS